jgi:multidrug efflux pump subunit AcrB
MDANAKSKSPARHENGPIAWMAKHPIAANLLMFILLGGGIWSSFNIQKEVFPQFQLDIVEVDVSYPGASPAEVEQGILQPVEEAARGISGIKEIVSTAREESGSIEFELVTGMDRIKVFQEIDQAVARIRTFPDDAEEPEVRLQAQIRDVMSIGLFGDVDIWTLRKLAERLRDRLLSEPNITQVEFGNVPDYITHVEIPLYRLREHGLTLGQVAERIEQSSRDIPAGAVETSRGEILLRLKERRQWSREFQDIVVVASSDGSRVTLGDIALIRDGFEENNFHSQYNQSPSVELDIFRTGTQSPLAIAETVDAVLEEFRNALPPGVQIRIDSSRARDYEERLSLLMENGFQAIFIVLFILAIFLRVGLAFWVMLGMVASFMGGLLLMPLFGLSLNMITMFGFIVVLGIIVDDAIVVGENIYEYRQRGLSYRSAAIKGVQDISGPVVFSILTSIVAFIPLLYLPGTTGKFWWPLPAVVILFLALSLFEALFILPAHLAHGSKKKSRLPFGRGFENVQGLFSEGFMRLVNGPYRRLLELCLRFRYVTLCAAFALLLVTGSYSVSDHMGMIMMPEVAADEIEAGVRLPVGVTIDQAAKVAEAVTQSTQRMFDEHDLYRVAEGIKTNVRGQNFIDVEIVMKPPAERDMTAAEVISLWRDEIGDIEGVDQITFEAERGPGGWRDDISVDLSHENVDVLEQASQSFFKTMESFEATRDVNDNFNRGKAQLDFILRPEGQLLGLTPEDVGRQVRDAFFGALAMRQIRGTNEVEIRVKLPRDERKNLHYLEDFVIRTPSGMEVPLLDVVEVQSGEAFTNINRRNGRRVVTVGMDVEPERATGRVLSAINTEVLPRLAADYPGLTWTFEGSQADLKESKRSLQGGFILAMAVVYALLAVIFGSYSQPFIVMVAIPFGVVGAVMGHILLGYDLSLISLMGLVALSGIVVNDSLIMIDYANRQRKDMGAFEAIHKAGLRRFRPIVLTTLTTFGGLAPIIFETSRQAYYLIPMAVSLGFGIIFSTAIILVIVPCLYMVLEDCKVLFSQAENP